MKGLFLGIGGIGARHARNVRKVLPEVELIAVRDSVNDVMNELSIRPVASLQDGIKEGPDFAVVALPPVKHAAVTEALIESDVPVYVEKPIAMRTAEIEAIAKKAEASNVTSMVGCNLRRCPGFVKLKELIDTKALGPVRHARLSVGQWLPDWRPHRDYREVFSSKRELGGGVLLELIHEFDLARFLFGEFDEVIAWAGHSGALEMDAEDHGDVVMRGNGMTVNIHLDCLDRAGTRQGRVICAEGTAVYDTALGQLDQYHAETGEWISVFEAGDFDANGALLSSMRHFLECVRSGLATDQPLTEGLESLRLSEKARLSSGLIA